MNTRPPKYYLEEYGKAYPFRHFILIYFFTVGIVYIALKLVLSIFGIVLGSKNIEFLIITSVSLMYPLIGLVIQKYKE